MPGCACTFSLIASFPIRKSRGMNGSRPGRFVYVLVWFLVGRLRLLVLAMRHKNTQTTEQFYARIRRDAAFFEIERAFERPVKVR